MNKPAYELARNILGKDFISPEDIAQSRKGVVYTDEQLSQFGDTVPSQEVLEWCRDNGYMLITGPNRPMSFLEVRSINRAYLEDKYGGWHTEHPFAHKDKTGVRWIMLRKEPVPGSPMSTWGVQQALLHKTEVTPNVAEVAWCVTTYRAVRNILLLGIYVRTSSLGSDSVRVCIGSSPTTGELSIDRWYDDASLQSLGLSAARK